MTPSGDTLERIKAQLRADQKIAAIKTLRETSGLSLAEAKAAVEKLQAELHAQDPQQYPLNDAPGCGGVGLLLALLIVGGLLLILWLVRR
jgi:hypothetical protein